MRIKQVIIFIFMFSDLIFSQNNDDNKIELSGTINYSYVKNKYDLMEGYSFLKYNISQVIEFQPSFAYKYFQSFQLLVSPFYNYQFSEYNLNSGYSESIEKYENHLIGFEIGSIYNLRLKEKMIIFTGAKLGFNWSKYRNLVRTNNYKWSNLRITFPILLAGAKYFVSENWAVIFQLQYKYMPNQSGWSNINSTYIIAGLGIATYI
ncbi:MAG: hypothetical protein IPM32_10940 [Ignavibacteriae bacterium]|nr:hypothetical protein [Ignavibacteriota bacterium]